MCLITVHQFKNVINKLIYLIKVVGNISSYVMLLTFHDLYLEYSLPFCTEWKIAGKLTRNIKTKRRN